ncbi:MAG: helix-turn-helix domain-containing protein [Treponema sp.]|jgi:AraC-like DNA-binding protein/ligand-binding sensor protein|nr:helix-turn-helix domain-containing protein [Treponema sp.]
MAKLSNIIQRRELEPLLHKALKVVKHYEKAANCAASVMGPDGDTGIYQLCSFCNQCKTKNDEKTGKTACYNVHKEAVNKARLLGGSYVYMCPEGYVFWTSPFYSGERFAGALFSGGIQGLQKNSDKVKALAQMMLICADQISGLSFNQKNIPVLVTWQKPKAAIPAEEAKINPALMDMERMLLASLRRGDNIHANQILCELIEVQYRELNGNFKVFRLKALEWAVLLSRATINSQSTDNDKLLETNNYYLKRIEESTNLKEIKEILLCFTDQMAERIFSFHGVRHFSAIRKAERYIWENYTKKIGLKEIADAAGLSASYFSSIFKEEMGENLSNYLNRLRVEKAAAMLISTNISISKIASACGFEDQSWFSKIFKNNTGFTPGKYREQVNILE